MQVPQLLLEALEELLKTDLEKLHWFLSLGVVEGYKAIPKAHLENASRTETVSKIIQHYGEESAVKVTVEILRKMNFNATADELENKYAAGKQAPSPAASAAAAASAASPPGSISAQQGSVVFAPTIVGGTSGAWNVTIKK